MGRRKSCPIKKKQAVVVVVQTAHRGMKLPWLAAERCPLVFGDWSAAPPFINILTRPDCERRGKKIGHAGVCVQSRRSKINHIIINTNNNNSVFYNIYLWNFSVNFYLIVFFGVKVKDGRRTGSMCTGVQLAETDFWIELEKLKNNNNKISCRGRLVAYEREISVRALKFLFGMRRPWPRISDLTRYASSAEGETKKREQQHMTTMTMMTTTTTTNKEKTRTASCFFSFCIEIVNL